MESPPVNRLLQLLRQRPSDDLTAAPAAQTAATPSPRAAPASTKRHPQHGMKSDTQPATSDTQPATSKTKSDTPPATKSDTPNTCSSSNKKLLLQDVLLEDAFQDLNPKSLIPYLDKFDEVRDFQDFLDMANACIAAANNGRGKPIKNPHGFLFAQLRQGYINPPEGYKSRRVCAQERRNQQLETELEELRKLKARERELRFELFTARLTPEDEARLAQEAQAQVKPRLGISEKRQFEVARENILKTWFAQQDKT